MLLLKGGKDRRGRSAAADGLVIVDAAEGERGEAGRVHQSVAMITLRVFVGVSIVVLGREAAHEIAIIARHVETVMQ